MYIQQQQYVQKHSLSYTCFLALLAITTLLVASPASSFTYTSGKCGRDVRIRSDSGTISRSRHKQYDDYTYMATECSDEVIPVSLGGKLVLTWVFMFIPDEMPSCSKASVTVYTGCGSKRKLIGIFCGRTKPFTIYTRSGGCLKIRYFDNNNFSKYSSWSLQYKFMKDTETLNNYGSWCSNSQMSSPSALISSAYWPHVHYASQQKCRWKITVPGFNRIKVFVYDMKFPGSTRLHGSDCILHRRDNYLAITYKGYKEASKRKLMCKSEIDTYTIISASNTFSLELVMNPNKGVAFLIGYIAYNTVNEVEKVESEEGVTTPTILIAACVTFCVLVFLGVGVLVRKRSRNMNNARRCHQERQELNQLNDGDGEEEPDDQQMPQIAMLDDPELSVEAPPPYSVSLNMPKPNQSSTTLDTSQQQIDSDASTGDDASSPPPTYNDVVRNHHPVSS